MRITTRLRIISAATVVAIVVAAPFVVGAFGDFRDAKNDFVLADAIKANFFDRTGIRAQYYLYREERLRAQWDESKAQSDELLRAAKAQMHDPGEQQLLERLGRSIDETAQIFNRVAANTAALRGPARQEVVE